MIDKNESYNLIDALLHIRGLSGTETNVAAYIKKRLQSAGVSSAAITHDSAHKRSPLGGEIGNLIVKLPGTLKAPRRLLMAHMDTVPLCAGAVPIKKGDYIESVRAKGKPRTGLGGDNRSGCAVVLNTALTILKHKLPHPPLTLFFAVQEEVGLMGARFVDVKKLGAPKLCFNWDGGAPNKLTVGATGAYRLYIDVHGIASHAGITPQNGASAIVMAGLALAELQRDGWHGKIKKGKSDGTSNVGLIQGGEATNVVTEFVRLKAEARSHDPVFRKKIVAAFKRAFENAAKQVRTADGRHGRVDFKADLHYESFRLKENEPTVAAAREAVTAAGFEPVLAVTSGGLDANWLSAHGLPTVSMGAGQADVHTVDERLHLPSYFRACDIALKLATGC